MGEVYIPELEQAVIGAVLLDNELMAAGVGVKADWFHDPGHREIVEAVSRRIADGREATMHNIAFDLKASRAVEALGGSAYLAKLLGTASRAGFKDNLIEVRNLWVRRTLSQELRQSLESIENFDQFAGVEDTISGLERTVAELATVTSHQPLVEGAEDGLLGALRQSADAVNAGGVVGLSTGIGKLDTLIGGFGPGDMITLAGRPSMGKTAIALTMAWRAAMSGKGVFFASLEMQKEQLWHRFLAFATNDEGSGIPYFDIRSGRISEEQGERLKQVALSHRSIPFMTAEKRARNLTMLRAAAKRSASVFERQGTPLGLVVVDYLQLIEGDSRWSDYQRVSAASNAIKSLALDLGVPVLSLSQLNRGVEMRDPPMPRLSDLRESGKVEEDSDVVILAFRDAYYLSKKLEDMSLDHDTRIELEAQLADLRHRCQLIVAKARGGPTGSVTMGFRPETNYVWDL